MNISPKTALYIFNFLLLIGCGNNVFARQWADTLKEVEINAGRIKDTTIDARTDFSAGQFTQSIDKQYLDLYESQSLANLLAQQTSVFVKSYGVNSMATLSLRGASAAQSAVLWNGVPLMNPALGVADLSLLQTGLFNSVSLKYGGSAALFGSGNVGGALLLDNSYPQFLQKKSLDITYGAGSFGLQNSGVNALWQNKKWCISLNGFYQQADNDIKYNDASGNLQSLDNARLQGGGGLLSVDYNLKSDIAQQHYQRLYFKAWVQAFDREIPPALFESYSVKEQKDKSIRTLLGYEKHSKRSFFYAKGSYNNEYLHYQDSAVALDNDNVVHQLYQETGWKYRLDNPELRRTSTGKLKDVHEILIFVPVQFSSASGNNITNDKTQFRPAIAAAYSYEGFQGLLKANASFRQEFVNGKAAPLLPGVGANIYLVRNKKFNVDNSRQRDMDLLLRANIQRTYRIPTLNELYYFPGGNPDLKPEQGWSQDAGYSFNWNIKQGNSKQLSITQELNFFNRNIQDWIYWLGGAIWTPHNIAKVHSRGLETNNKVSYQFNEFVFSIGLNYTYVLSTTEASYLPGDGSIGKQIPYTPRYNAQGNFGFQWRNKLFLNINQTYAGYRFVTVDESQYLDPYTTTNFQSSYKFDVAHYRFQIVAQVKNIFNADYEVVNARPMPGRNFLMQFKVGI